MSRYNQIGIGSHRVPQIRSRIASDIEKTFNNETKSSQESDKAGTLGAFRVKCLRTASSKASSVGGKIGRNVKEFFSAQLPRAFSAVCDSITACFPKKTQKSTAVELPPVSASKQGQPFDPSVNEHLDKPFSQKTASSIVDEIKCGFSKDQTLQPINIRLSDVAESEQPRVAQIFGRDIGTRIGQFRYNEEKISSVPYKDISEDYGLRQPLIDFYKFLNKKGVDDEDILQISKICNQALFGAYSAACYNGGDLDLHLPDGDSIVLSSDDKNTIWNISKREDGFDIDISASGELRTLPTRNGQVFNFSDKSRFSQEFKIELRRENGLQLKALTGKMNVVAYDENGSPLTPAAVRDMAAAQGT